MTITPAVCAHPLGLGEVRAALAAALGRVEFPEGTPLRVNAWMADQYNPPCALIGASRVTFRDPAYSMLNTIEVPVRLVVPVPANRPAQLDLETLLDAWFGALNDDTTLNGTVRRVLAVDAVPLTVLKGNAELPAYECTTRCVL